MNSGHERSKFYPEAAEKTSSFLSLTVKLGKFLRIAWFKGKCLDWDGGQGVRERVWVDSGSQCLPLIPGL